MRFYKISVFFLFFVLIPDSYGENIIKMTYKDGDKKPLIQKEPDNSGAYLDLFTEAAKMIGYKIIVKRLPKKRLHDYLKKGKLDFYPGASFSKKRAKYLYYIENGFNSGEYGITAKNIPEITNVNQLKKLKLTWLLELGSSKIELANRLKLEIYKINFANIEKMQMFVSKRTRSFFYIADKELVDYYLKKTDYKSFEEAGLKVHKNCLGGDKPMYMAFSRKSSLYKEKINPNYKKNKPISISNFPEVIDKNCIAYKLGQALKKMKKSGRTQKIYDKYFSM
ncbi:MAG: amino acid ABC transporter substrate-binding protein [Desulfobacterales bacterium]|nr:amino acid ABC transporter substrate-binding protein [Desulfobacterales bacterium]MCP4161540.1 amino acid ABC transporter substrate-binding protein [Deltaproteobacteria bacterium]